MDQLMVALGSALQYGEDQTLRTDISKQINKNQDCLIP